MPRYRFAVERIFNTTAQAACATALNYLSTTTDRAANAILAHLLVKKLTLTEEYECQGSIRGIFDHKWGAPSSSNMPLRQESRSMNNGLCLSTRTTVARHRILVRGHKTGSNSSGTEEHAKHNTTTKPYTLMEYFVGLDKKTKIPESDSYVFVSTHFSRPILLPPLGSVSRRLPQLRTTFGSRLARI